MWKEGKKGKAYTAVTFLIFLSPLQTRINNIKNHLFREVNLRNK